MRMVQAEQKKTAVIMKRSYRWAFAILAAAASSLAAAAEPKPRSITPAEVLVSVKRGD
jgi:hypothetical protein